jgi:glycopeptide antibiotics resistance protein
MSRRIAAAYVAVVLALTLLPIFGLERDDPVQVQLVPFDTIVVALRSGFFSREFALLVANLAMLMPLGVFIPLLTGRRRWLHVLGGALALSGGIELTQLAISLLVGFQYRTASVDDVITNVAGALLGYMAFVAYESLRQWQARPGDR